MDRNWGGGRKYFFSLPSRPQEEIQVDLAKLVRGKEKSSISQEKGSKLGSTQWRDKWGHTLYLLLSASEVESCFITPWIMALLQAKECGGRDDRWPSSLGLKSLGSFSFDSPEPRDQQTRMKGHGDTKAPFCPAFLAGCLKNSGDTSRWLLPRPPSGPTEQ